MAHSGPELGKSRKNPINATFQIITLYKLPQCFIILLGVYCKKFFGGNRWKTCSLGFKDFCISYV